MADRKPLKVLPDSASGSGGGDSTGLGEFVAADTIGVVDGGTGLSAVGNNQLLTGHSSSTTGALTSQANLTFDGTTLVNTGQSIGVGEAPSTWHSGFDFVQIGGTLALASQPGVQASQAAYIVQNAHYDSDGSWEYQATDEAHRIGMSSGNITFDNAASDTAGNDITWKERLRIDASGNLRIVSIANGVGRLNFADPDATDVGRVQYDHSSNSMEFYANAAERMRLTSAGNLGIGMDTPGYRLNVVGDSTGWLSEFRNDNNSSPYGLALYWPNAAPDNNTNLFFNCQDSSAARAKIYADGDVWTSDAGTLTSDERLKTNIVDATSKLADVMRLKVRNFEWAPEYHPNKVGEKKIGFIAQELEEVFPSLVSEHDIASDNSIQEQLYTEEDDIPDGKEIGDVKVEAKAHEPTMRKSYKNAFGPILVKALQEVTTRLEAAEAKIAALEEA